MALIVYDETTGAIQEVIHCTAKHFAHQVRVLDGAKKTYIQVEDTAVPWSKLPDVKTRQIMARINTSTKAIEVSNG